jgi:hypothetical protein
MPVHSVPVSLTQSGGVNLTVEETCHSIIRIAPEQLQPCYTLLQSTFHAGELNSAAEMLADLSAAVSTESEEQFVMLACLEKQEQWNVTSDAVVSLIAGCYLALDHPKFSRQSIGFIEYLVTEAAFRRHGNASALLIAFEQEMLRIAACREEQLCLIMGEVEPDLVDFKVKRGYHHPKASQYAQPPIAFDVQTGLPMSTEIPMILMVKSWIGAIKADLLLQAVQVIFKKRYVPKNMDKPATQEVITYINEFVYAPFEASLQVDGGLVMMD